VGILKCEGVVCKVSDQCYVVGVCEFIIGVCSNLVIVDEMFCNDENVCMIVDVCKVGECIGGEFLDCNDDNSCTIDLCEFVSGC